MRANKSWDLFLRAMKMLEILPMHEKKKLAVSGFYPVFIETKKLCIIVYHAA